MAFDPQKEMLRRMESCDFRFRIREEEPLAAWQERARSQLMKRLGLPLERVDPAIETLWKRDKAGYTETRFVFHSEQDLCVPCHLLVPGGPYQQAKAPLVVCLQGHSTGMHISLGQPKYAGDKETIAGDRDFAVQAVKRGYAALTVEQRAFGESGGTPKGPACQQVAMQALLLGRTLIGERVWDVSRAIDVITVHFPEVDAQRIAVMGNSGGGTTAIYAAAADPRIAAAMPSCAICGYMASIGAQTHCTCNYVPGIMQDFDMADLMGMVAPRPLVVVNGRDDRIFPLSSAEEQVHIAITRYYAKAQAADNLVHVIGQGGHRFYAQEGWTALERITGWGVAQ